MTDKRDNPKCTHSRVGIVTSHPGEWVQSEAHAATSVCGSPSCRADAIAWVHRLTGKPGTYISDSTRKVQP